MAEDQNIKLPRWHLPLQVLLGAAGVASVFWLVQEPPQDRLAQFALVILPAAAGAGIAYLTNLSTRLKNSLGVFALIAGLVAATVLVLPQTGAGADEEVGSSPPPSKSNEAEYSPAPSGAAPDDPSASSETSSSESPLIITAPINSECPAYVVQDPTALPSDRANFDADWVWSAGGGDLYNPQVLAIEGPKDRAVIITGIDVIDIKRQSVSDGAAMVLMCGPGGGDLGYRKFGFDIKGDATTAKLEAAVKAEDFPFKVSSTDPELFEIEFDTGGERCICSFRFRLNWLSEGKKGSVTIEREDGLEFSSSSDRDLTQYEWLEGESLRKSY